MLFIKQLEMKTINNFSPYLFQRLSVERGLDIYNEFKTLFLLDETGLGKTITSSTIVLNSIKYDEKLLVITTNANKKSWDNVLSNCDINYKITGNRNIPNYQEKYDHIIIDECHRIGRYGGKTFMEIFKLSRYNKSSVILVSATPYNNDIDSLLELFMLTNLPQEIKTVIDIQCSVITYLNKENKKFNQFNKKDGKYISFQAINKGSELTHELNNRISEFTKLFSILTIRNKRSSIVIDSNEELLKKFPTVAKNQIEYQITSNDVETKAVRDILIIINKMSFAWQNQVAYFLPEMNGSFGFLYKSTLFKRLESSVVSFSKTLQNTKNNINECLSNGEITIGETTYTLTNLFIDDLLKDIEYIDNIALELLKIENDYKANELLKFISFLEKGEKVVVFTEYSDTLNHLSEILTANEIKHISFDSNSPEKLLDTITDEFDANLHKTDKYNVLLCTDVLAEGTNLHYANKLYHYDGKWNPSRIIQREGRINRICQNPKDIEVVTFQAPFFIDSLISLVDKNINKIDESNLVLDYLTETTINDLLINIDKFEVKENKSNVFSANANIVISYKDKFLVLNNNQRIVNKDMEVLNFYSFFICPENETVNYTTYNSLNEVLNAVADNYGLKNYFKVGKSNSFYYNNILNKGRYESGAFNYEFGTYQKYSLSFSNRTNYHYLMPPKDNKVLVEILKNYVSHSFIYLDRGLIKLLDESAKDKNKTNFTEGLLMFINPFLDKGSEQPIFAAYLN